MPLIIPSNSQSASGYTIGQSIRFNDDDTAYMHRTPSSSGNRDKWTWSSWIKRGNLTDANATLFQAGDDSQSANYTTILFNGNSGGIPNLKFNSVIGSSTKLNLQTTQYFRDVSAWYHIVCVYDSDNDVSTERARIYINGSRVTDFSTETYPSQNQDSMTNHTVKQSIGRRNQDSSRYMDGYMAEIHLLDGYAYDPSFFGEFNDSGIWIPKQYTGSYGTNGFKIDGRDSSDLGDDESGNVNDFTTSGLAAHDQVLDSPTNNFAIYNIMDNFTQGATFSNGNLERTRSGSNRSATMSNIGMNSGKWYCEIYIASHFQTTTMVGVQGYRTDAEAEWPGNGVTNQGVGYYMSNGYKYINGSGSTYGNTYAVGDIIGIALDLDNEFVYFSKNGTFQDSGDPTSGSSGTGGIDIVTSPANTETGFWFFAIGDGSTNSGSRSSIINFGQEGTFAGNVTAGGNSDGNGIGNFKYSVPSGYLALCTKNLGS